MQRQRQRRLDVLPRQALEHAQVADGGEHQVLVADAAVGAEQVDGLQHVVEVVRRLAHAHEHHLLHRPETAGEGDLGDDLGAADLAQQAALAGHAEHAAHRAADLGRHAQTVPGQQHALDHLPVGQLDQQARRAVGTGVLGTQPRQAGDFLAQCRQRRAHRQREIVLGRTVARPAVECPAVQPGAQDPPAVAGLGAAGGETGVEVLDAHRARILPLARRWWQGTRWPLSA